MKPQDFKNHDSAQGSSTADRAFTNQRAAQKQNGVSNSGTQQSFVTSSKDGAHNPQKKKH
jgi:hypothetical protein